MKSEDNNLNQEDVLEITISVVRANVYAVILTLPLFVLLTFIYFNGISAKEVFKNTVSIGQTSILFIASLAGIIAHELLHGITWAIFCKDKMKSIRFGFIKKYLTPYCNCKEWLSRRQYIIGALAPLVALGFLPYIISCMNKEYILFLFSLCMMLGAGGDLAISLIVLFKVPSKSMILDHPSKIGCLYKKSSQA